LRGLGSLAAGMPGCIRRNPMALEPETCGFDYAEAFKPIGVDE
jgi:hypothetical protein